MYINLRKVSRIIGFILALLVLVFGVLTFVIAISIQEQITSALVSIFGLQLMWFILWVTKPRYEKEARNEKK